MNVNPVTTVALALAAGLAAAGCSDIRTPTESPPDPIQPQPFFSYAPATGFDALRRHEPLLTDVSTSQVIGVEGGEIVIPTAGVSLVVPALALSADTQITVTALAGDAVAFEFAPHGLQFLVPAAIRVRVEGTEAEDELEDLLEDTSSGHDRDDDEEDLDDLDSGSFVVPLNSFIGVYFEGDPSLGVVEPLERIDTFLQDGHIVFPIQHFSGYVTASG